MSISRESGSRQGFIIVVTLVLMLVMMTMGVALFYSAKQTVKQVNTNVEKGVTYLLQRAALLRQFIGSKSTAVAVEKLAGFAKLLTQLMV